MMGIASDTLSFDTLTDEAAALIDRCRAAGVILASGESCTGGLIAAILTEVPGSSDVVERGFVAYSNQAKTDLLSVPKALIDMHGAVSEPVARAMAEGVLAASPAAIAIAVTGIAGPGGGTEDKPVGLVHLAVARRGGRLAHDKQLFGNRSRREIRLLTVQRAFALAGALL
jgi:nicotinamide-nucleotide amidase